MATELDLTQPAAPGTEVALRVDATPSLMFSDTAVVDALFKHIADQIAGFTPDTSTAAGRKDIASLAYKVAQTKTAVDAAGKTLGDAAREVVSNLNKQRTAFKERFESLQAKAREPLDKWEAAEAARQKTVADLKEMLRTAGVVALGATAKDVRDRYLKIKAIAFDKDMLAVLQENEIIVKEMHRVVVATLENAYARLVKEEADAAELRRLQEAEQRRQVEESNRAAAEESSRQLAEKSYYEDWTAADAENGRRDAAAAADAAAVERERKRIADEAAEATRLENERRANETHRASVTAEIKAALLEKTGMSKRAAELLVPLLIAGAIPHVTVTF